MFFVSRIRNILVLLSTALISSQALAGGVLIGITDPDDQDLKAPAVDLLAQDGTPLDRDEVVDLIRAGVDTSLLDPDPNIVWTPRALPSNESEFNYPPEGSTLFYDSDIATKAAVRARAAAPDGRPFTLIMSLDLHGALARATLLRKLGYAVPTPKYYETLTLRFSTIQLRDKFLDGLSDRTQTDRHRWIKALPDKSPEVTLQDLVLEPGRIQVAPYHWGGLGTKDVQSRRAIRALIVPLVLLDLSTESINLFSWEIGKILSGNVSLSHPYAEVFAETTWEDARWITRKIARLSRLELEEIVRSARLPEPAAAVVTEKLVSRRNQLIELFRLENELPRNVRQYAFNEKISRTPGLKNGKILQELYPGHAERFTFGDPKSPLRAEEVSRYLLQESIAAGISAAVSKLNDLLDFYGPADIAKTHQEDLFKAFIEHIQKNPKTPFEAPVGAWAGPTGSLQTRASRNLITGSYYGSDSMLQLVDSVAASANVGFFMGIDGLPKTLVPGISGNLSVQRNYIHVRPVLDTKTALKTSWKWLAVPGFMQHLGNILEPEGKCKPVSSPPDSGTEGGASAGVTWDCAATTPADDLAPAQVSKNLDALYAELKEGEILMVTDTLASGLAAQLSIPISALINADLSGTSGAFTFGSQGQAQILRKTTLSRTKKGIQIYVQHANIRALNVTFDFNFWMKIFRASYGKRTGNAEVRAFLLGEKPTEEAAQRKLLIALKALLKSNNPELVETTYPSYRIDHKMPSHAWRAHFLPWTWTALEEGHRFAILPPEDAEGRYKPEEHKRTFFTHRIVHKKETNYSALITNVIGGFLPGEGVEVPGSDNAATSLIGKARWASVLSEAETTPGRETTPVTTIEHHWQGPSLSRTDFFSLLEALERSVRSMKLPYSLFQREFFVNLKRLELYDIQSNLLIYEKGIKKIRDELLGKRKISQQALFQHLIDVHGRTEYRQWCETEFRFKQTAPGEQGDYQNPGAKADEVLSGRGWMHDCMKPWINKIMKQISHYPSGAEARVKWTAELVQTLEKNLEFAKFLSWLGQDGFFFQVRVSGFRNGQEDGDSDRMAGQKYGESDYLSSSIGNMDPELGAGPIKAIIHQTGLSGYEVYARYLSEEP